MYGTRSLRLVVLTCQISEIQKSLRETPGRCWPCCVDRDVQCWRGYFTGSAERVAVNAIKAVSWSRFEGILDQKEVILVEVCSRHTGVDSVVGSFKI